MSFHRIDSLDTVNIVDITKALKYGSITVEEAAILMDRVKIVDSIEERLAEIDHVGYAASMIDDSWLRPHAKNSFGELSSELSDPEYRETYYKLMDLLGFGV